ncbi:hypothetical protein JOC37_000668 [Desulfohalotomaculum tongense]|uniref:hypothetical protein n=1 Tax=Desulforadius tongensis TaxID=1216062 RepID=UPI0019596818|nr:hypothetical protein [Desulforadius tongensis]MBM7854295.1 hypothetical protein [Desulforadius tongensis]
MAIRKICVQEITTLNQTDSFTVTCTTPAHTPVDSAHPPECNVALFNVAFTTNPFPTISFSYCTQLKYAYMEQGTTFESFCNINNQSRSITFDSDVNLCGCDEAFTMTYSATCNPNAITTTATSVSGPVTFSFTLNNLCAQTIICIDDTTCP